MNITEQEEKQMYDDWQKSMDEYDQKWIDAKDELEGLIHPKYFDFAEENDTYYSEGIVEIIETDERNRFYPNYKCCRVKGDAFLYIYHTDELESIQIESEHEGESIEYYCWQTTGYMEDDYSGFLLLPLLDGKRFWKVGYSC